MAALVQPHIILVRGKVDQIISQMTHVGKMFLLFDLYIVLLAANGKMIQKKNIENDTINLDWVFPCGKKQKYV